MRIRWTPAAAGDLESIKNYLERNYTPVATSTVRVIYQRIRTLKESPNRGRPGHRNGTRELVLLPLPYVVVYRVDFETVEVLHLYHSSQDWRV